MATLGVPAVAVLMWVATFDGTKPETAPAAVELPAQGELAREIDATLEGVRPGAIPDGAWYALVLSSELLGGAGDPRGVDTWATSGYDSVERFAQWISEYVQRGHVEGYLRDYPELADLLLVTAAVVRDVETAPKPLSGEPPLEVSLARETVAALASALNLDQRAVALEETAAPEPDLAAMIRRMIQQLNDPLLIDLFGQTADALDQGQIGKAAEHLRQLRGILARH